MAVKKISVAELQQSCTGSPGSPQLRLLGGGAGLQRTVSVPDINRPGLELAGFFETFDPRRIQLFGRGEALYLQHLLEAGETGSLCRLLHSDIPCCIFSRDVTVSGDFLSLAEECAIAVFQADLPTGQLQRALELFLDRRFAPIEVIHGVMLEVYGLGVLIVGPTGIGKSECALELVERGHRLIADDLVQVKRLADGRILGNGVGPIPHHMEIRGLGIINVSMLFGAGSIWDFKEVDLVMELEIWNETKAYDRTGLVEKHWKVLGVEVPSITLPISPVRNVPVLIETAVRNQRLKKMGYHSAREFDSRLKELLSVNQPEIR